MVDFETELKIAKELFEKRLKTFKRIKYHLGNNSETSDAYSAGEVALKIANTELHNARQQLENVIQSIRNQPCDSPVRVELNDSEERDHFSDALDLVDPESRLQLGR